MVPHILRDPLSYLQSRFPFGRENAFCLRRELFSAPSIWSRNIDWAIHVPATGEWEIYRLVGKTSRKVKTRQLQRMINRRVKSGNHLASHSSFPGGEGGLKQGRVLGIRMSSASIISILVDEDGREGSREPYPKPQDFLSSSREEAMIQVLTHVALEGKVEETGLILWRGNWPVGKCHDYSIIYGFVFLCFRHLEHEVSITIKFFLINFNWWFSPQSLFSLIGLFGSLLGAPSGSSLWIILIHSVFLCFIVFGQLLFCSTYIMGKKLSDNFMF